MKIRASAAPEPAEYTGIVRTKLLTYTLPLLGLSLLVGACSDGADTDGAGTNSGGTSSGVGGTVTTGGSGGVPSTGSGAGPSSGGVPGTGGAPETGGGPAVGGSGGSGGGENPAPECVPNGKARNALVSHIFTADPNAAVYGDRIYVYVSHDVDGQEGFDMIEHRVFSSDDLANWQDHGVIIRTADLRWAGRLYAPGACEKDGKYYMYLTNGGSAIGVAVADDPGGPFVDPIGRGFLTPSFPNANVPWLFDPACYVDDDGQAYLYFGGGPSGNNARVVRLNDDMVSIKDSAATTLPTTAFFEAAFMHKRDGKYYLSYSSDFSSGHGAALEYYIGDSPMMQGSQYKGKLLNNGGVNSGNNNHGSIVEFQGKSYIFYHNRKLMQSLGTNKVNNRSIAIEELTYAEDGSINAMSMSTSDFTVSQLKCLNGFEEVEAERFGAERGIEVFGDSGKTVRVADLDPGDWVAYSQVDFRNGATKLVAKVAAEASGGTIDVVLDGCIDGSEGTSVGTCTVQSTGGLSTYSELTCAISAPGGAHDLCLKFSGNTAFELDSFHLEE